MRWEPVASGRSGANVSRSAGAYRKEDTRPTVDLRLEGERLEWLRSQGIRAPVVLDCSSDVLVTEEVPGRSAGAAWPEHVRPGVVDSLARLARDLHSLPVDDCPFDRRLVCVLPEALAWEVDLDDLDDERRGWDRDRLVHELVTRSPPVEDLAVCHGDLSVANVLLDPETLEVTGVIDSGRLGVADRWTDLAIATRSLASRRRERFGAWAGDRFLASYGIEPDVAKIGFYRLLDEFF